MNQDLAHVGVCVCVCVWLGGWVGEVRVCVCVDFGLARVTGKGVETKEPERVKRGWTVVGVGKASTPGCVRVTSCCCESERRVCACVHT